MSAFATEQKRAIAIQLISAGRCTAADWSSLSQAVHNESVGILPDGRLVARPRPRRPAKQLFSIDEAAGMAGVHPATIRRWIKCGKLTPCGTESPALSIRRGDLEALLSTRQRE